MGAHKVVRFNQADLKRAVKGCEEGGLRIGRVEIDRHGKIVIIPMGAPETKAHDTSWDDV